MPNTVHLFDFDQTLTVHHTFKHTERSLFPNASEADMYQMGKEEFDRNRKPGAESFFIHNDQQASAIATFHNNPSMVAGFLSRMLGDKELTPVNTQVSGPYAVTTYQVKGSNTPVLVSWINASSAEEFNGTIATLQQQNIHKNGQLSFLHQCMSNQNIIQPTTDIHYFDDSQANIIAAESLPFRVQRHQVSYDPTFDFTNIGPTANQVVQPLQSNPTPVAANAAMGQAQWPNPSSGIGYPQPSTSYPGNAQAQTNPEPKSNRASTAVLADNDEAHLYTIASPQSRGAINNATSKSTPQENSEAHLYTIASPQSRGATNNATPKPTPQENSEAHLYTMASPQSRGVTNNTTPKPAPQDNSEAHLYTIASPQSRGATNNTTPKS
nr:hypothetical protein [Legionella jordanis]